MEKILSLTKFYTDAVGGVGDKYEVWSSVNLNIFEPLQYWDISINLFDQDAEVGSP